MALSSNPSSVASDRSTGRVVESYPGAKFVGVGKPFFTPVDDPTLFADRLWEFYNYLSTDDGLTLVTGSGDGGSAALLESGTTGVLQLTPGGDLNDEVYIGSTSKFVTLTASKKLWFDSKVRITEPRGAGRADNNAVIGLCSQYSENTLQDSGAGPVANADFAMFYLAAGTAAWYFGTSHTTTQLLTTTGTARSTGTWIRLSFYWNGSTITPYVNGTAGTVVAAAAASLPTAAMGLLMGSKNNYTSDSLLDVEFIRIVAER